MRRFLFVAALAGILAVLYFAAPQITPSISSPESGPWKVQLTDQEIKPSRGLTDDNLVYAAKNKRTTKVLKRDLRNGAETAIFSFDEAIEAAESGNTWDEQPPGVALSRDGKALAYVDQDGLKIFDLPTGISKTLIQKVPGAADNDSPPGWSKPLGRVFNLAEPRWSSDGKYIRVLEILYEGFSMGLINTETGDYTNIPLPIEIGLPIDLTWAPIGHSFVCSGCDPDKLRVSHSESVHEWADISEKSGWPCFNYYGVSYSPDGNRLAFACLKSLEDYNSNIVAVTGIDGSDFNVIEQAQVSKKGTEPPLIQIVGFSPDGANLLFVTGEAGKQILVRHALSGKERIITALMPPEYNFWDRASWTKEGFLTIQGFSWNPEVPPPKRRFLILDLSNRAIVYASPTFSRFTRFLGLSGDGSPG